MKACPLHYTLMLINNATEKTRKLSKIVIAPTSIRIEYLVKHTRCRNHEVAHLNYVTNH